MKRLGQKICVAVALSLATVAIWHDSVQAAMPVIVSIGEIKGADVGNPTRIDVDAAGTLYLSDGNANGVRRIDKYGKALPVLKGGAYIVRAGAIAVTPDGSRVYVAVLEPGKLVPTAVGVLDGSTGALLGYLGNGFNEFARVVEIDLDASGNIYVGNFDKAKTPTNLVNTARVDVYSGTTYQKIRSFGAPATNLVTGYYLPRPGEFGEISGLTVDVASNEVLVSEAWNNNGISRVQIFGTDGTFKRLLPETIIAGPVGTTLDPLSGAKGPTQVNCKPVGLSVDNLGRVYMLSILTSTIHVFTTEPDSYLGRYTKGIPDPAFDPITGKVYPWTAGMIPTPSFDTIFDPLTGRLFVVTDGNGIQIFGVDGSTNPVKTNVAPAAPALLGPVQGVKVATLTPSLQWSPAIDADNDPLTYNVQILALNGAVVSTKNGVSETSLAVASETLQENNFYRWQVQAADAEFVSPYSAAESFWVNAVEEAPAAALLSAPANGVTANKATTFSWQAAADADPFDSVSYRLEVARNNDFSVPLVRVNQAGLTSAALSTLPGYDDLQSGMTYQWRVVSVDSTGLTTASEVRTFSSNSAPAIPVLSIPVQGQEVTSLTPTLQWEAAFDADGDALTYNVKIVDANGAVVEGGSGIASTSFAVTTDTLSENSKYGWQVQAVDAELASAYSAVESFWVNADEEYPSVVLPVDPAAGVAADKDTVFSWGAATDADPAASLTYRLEISADADFTAPLVVVEQAGLTSDALSTLPGYADLQPYTSYYWRVVAIDNTGLTAVSEARSFNYISTVLTVDATFPGAKVYLGGNGAYNGRYVGEVPLTLRDVNPGTLEVVVERAGFEPWVQSVVVSAAQSTTVNAELVVAILPGDYKKASLIADGIKVQVAAEAAPVLVDFDSDGINDLLVGDGSGKLTLYSGIEGAESPFSGGNVLAGVSLPAGVVPFVADWNNDDRKDLIVGAANGSVSLYLNVGTQEAPLFAAAVLLQADNAPLNVVSNAAPLLYDLNQDGAKDLLVGSGNGNLYSFLNIGTDAAPVFAAREILIPAAAGAVNASAVVADWDADGSKEILFAAGQEVALYERADDGSYVKGAPLLVHQSLYNSKTRSYEMMCSSFGENIRIVASNLDEKSGKDLLIGNAAGEILLAYSTVSKASAISPFFDQALLETVAEIEELIQSKEGLATSTVTSTLSQLKKNIKSQSLNKLSYYDKAKQNVASLQVALQSDSEVSVALGELQAQLDSSVPLAK